MKNNSKALRIAVYIPNSLGGVRNVTSSLADAIEGLDCEVFRCQTILQLINARFRGVNIAIFSLHAGILTPFFSQVIQIVHGFPMKPTHKMFQFLAVNGLIKYAKFFGAKTVSVSDFTTVICRRIFGIKIDATIHNGVSDLFYADLGEISKSKIVLFAGRFDFNKKPTTVVSAFLESKLPDLGYTLVMVGDGPEMGRLSQITNKHRSVSILGEVSEKQKVEIFRSADIFISLHDLEPMGVVFAEAMVSKCKVICPSTGGQLGFFPTYYPLFLTSLDDPGSIVNALNSAAVSHFEPDWEFPCFRYDNIAKAYLQIIGRPK
jgi:glycosyltransferase involved in cell wall biosynthesis